MPTFYLLSDYSPTGGPVSASGSPGAIGNGFTDVVGNVWSIDSSNVLHPVATGTNPWNNDVLARTATPDLLMDSQWVTRITYGSTESPYFISRYSRAASTTTGYIIGISSSGGSALQAFTIISGSLTQIGSTASISLNNGQQYDVTTSTVQTNGTTTTLTISVADTSGTVIGSTSWTDTTSALQNITGGTGMFASAVGGSTIPASYNRIRAYTDINGSANSYQTNLASIVNLGQSLTGTFTLLGGTNLTSSLSITLSDSSSGTFSPNPVVIPSGTASATFTYTPASAGSKTVSYTHTGGNASMTGDASTSVTVTSYHLISDFTPVGTVSAGSTPGNIGGGFTDVTGGVWSIDSSNILHQVVTGTNPWNNDLLSRTNTVDALVSGQQIIRFTFDQFNAIYTTFRQTRSGTNTTAYLIGYSTSGSSLQALSCVSGTNTQIGSTLSATLSNGTQYDLITTCVQTNGTTTSLSASILDTSGNVLYTTSWTDTTSALQNVSSATGLFFSSSNAGAIPGAVSRIRTYNSNTPSSATGYAATVSSTGLLNVPSTIILALTGGTALTAPLVITITEDSNGVISLTPITIPTTNTGSSFTYTPKTAGTRTLTFSHTGGNASMTGDGTATVTIPNQAFLDASSSAVVLSPWGWAPSSQGGGARQTIYSGQYMRFYVKGCTSAILIMDTTYLGGSYMYSVDNGPCTVVSTVPSNGQQSITIPDTGSHYITVALYSLPGGSGTQRWTRQVFFGVVGMLLATGGTADPTSVVIGSKRIMFLGDSITEGWLANNGVAGVLYVFSYLDGQALLKMGYEYGVCGLAGQGYTATGNGGTVPIFTIGNDAQSAWNKMDVSSTRLDTSGKLSPQPTLIFENHGTNDSAQGHLGNALSPTLAQQITAFYLALRASAPSAIFIKSIPFGGYARSDINTAMAAYQTALPDSNQTILDLKIDAFIPSYTNDNVHPNIWGNANIAPLVLAPILTALNRSSGGGGSAGPTPFFPGTVNF